MTKSLEAKSLIQKFLLTHPLATLETRIKQAAAAKLFSSELAESYHIHALSVGYWEFINDFRQVFFEHRCNSDKLCEILAYNETLSLRELEKLLSDSIKLDAAVMGYTRSLNNYPDLPGHCNMAKGKISELCGDLNLTEEDLQILFTPYLFDSFPIVLVHDVYALRSGNSLLSSFADTYTHGISEIAESILADFHWLDQNSMTALIDNRSQSRMKYRQLRYKILEQISIPLKFEDIEIEIQGLLYIDNYIEEKSRFALTDGIGDVILRHTVAKRLFQSGVITDMDPFSVPQTKLLALLREIAKEEK